MQNLIELWSSLTPRRRIVTVLATLLMFAAVYGLAQVATRPSMALLYAGIDGQRAGEVLAALDQQGAKYEVRGQAIYVTSDQRDRLRMDLATQGLPSNSGEGYELLDGLSGFGTTSQMFDAAYWRAKEGELARTIASLPGMRGVRVHISNTEPAGLQAAPEPKASVTLAGAATAMSPDQARALRFLVSAAVAGMKPEDVAVIDGRGRLVRPDTPGPAEAGDDRAQALRANVLRLLEARVGAGHAQVELSVDTVTDSEQITERQIDPQGRVAISSQTDEKTSSSQDQGGAGVTVASNLPSGAAGGGGKSAQKNDSQSSERLNYDVSETRREVVKAPGAVRRLTVAVLVDGVTTADANGQTKWAPRPDDELGALRELVAAAVGFDEKRGDVLTIKTLAFEPIGGTGSGPASSLIPPFALDVMTIIQLGVLSIVALVLGLFVVRPVLAGRATTAQPAPRALSGPGALVAVEAPLTGVIEDADAPPRDLPQPARRPAAPAVAADDPVARLRRLMAERQDESVEILKGWMGDVTEQVD